VEEAVAVGVEKVAVRVEVVVHHKLMLEVEVVAVEEVVALGVGVEVADRTVLPGLEAAVRGRRFLRPGLGILLVHPTREALAQQTLAPRETRVQQT
jgi:hypothetical protein